MPKKLSELLGRDTRNQRDRSAFILEKCINILPEGGMLGIILTDTMLDQQRVEKHRRHVLKECQLVEQWDIPVGWFEGVKRPALAWVLRKAKPISKIVNYIPLSDVPAPGREVKLYEAMHVDSHSPPPNLVPIPSEVGDVLAKLGSGANRIEEHYNVCSGLQPRRDVIKWNKTPKAHPWSGNAIKTGPFSDFSMGSRGWLEPSRDNLAEKSPNPHLRKNYLEKNEPMVMFRASRNNSHEYKWDSIALIDIPANSQKVVAPSESFHAVFSKCNAVDNKIFHLFALWAICNHPMASLWFHEKQRVQKISTYNLKKLPLPDCWTTENIKGLAADVKNLLELGRSALFPVRPDSKIMGRPAIFPAKPDPKIRRLIKSIDDTIYKMYDIGREERDKVENWLGMQKRPLFKGMNFSKEMFPKRPPEKRREMGADATPDAWWETTFEVLDVFFETRHIQIEIDGLPDDNRNSNGIEEGFRLKIIPAMPGWLLEKGAIGWIELTTYDVEKLIKFPEKYIVGFRLHKNAYESQEEIDADLFSPAAIQTRRA